MQIDKQNMKASLTMEEVNKVMLFLNAIDQSRKNKLTYAATQLGEEIESKTKAFNKKALRLSYDYALKNESGDFKTTEKGGLVLDPKKIMEYNDKKDELAANTTIDLDLYYCNDQDLISELPITFLKGLNGILFEYDFSKLETSQSVKASEPVELQKVESEN